MRTRIQYDARISAMELQFQQMGEAAIEMLHGAVIALSQGDDTAIEKIIDHDDIVDRINLELETECVQIIIREQPVAHDLRVIGALFKAITDLERIADHAVDIAKAARQIHRETSYDPIIDITLLAGKVDEMLNMALKAFANHDITLAEQTILADDAVDDLFHIQRTCLLDIMGREPLKVKLASHLFFVIQFLERIGDRCVNIAERVCQIQRGASPQRQETPSTH